MKLQDAQQYAKEIIEKYNLNINPTIDIIKRRKRYWGIAYRSENKIELNLSGLLNRPLRKSKNTIRHELAHIKAYTERGYGHGKIFQKWAKYLNVKETNFYYKK